MDAKTLHDMFWLGVPVLEKILRPITIYAFLIVSLRLAGKRELAQLNPNLSIWLRTNDPPIATKR